MSTQPIPETTRKRLIKLPCNGVRRWGVGKQGKLTYSEAYDAIFKKERCETTKDGLRFTPQGINRLINLNSLYADYAKDFILAKQAAQKKEMDSIMEDMQATVQKVADAQKELDALLESTSADPSSPLWPNAEQAQRMADLREFLNRFAKKDKHECSPLPIPT